MTRLFIFYHKIYGLSKLPYQFSTPSRLTGGDILRLAVYALLIACAGTFRRRIAFDDKYRQ